MICTGLNVWLVENKQSDKLQVSIMENLLGEFWVFKVAAIAGFVYLVYVFIKDQFGKKK